MKIAHSVLFGLLIWHCGLAADTTAHKVEDLVEAALANNPEIGASSARWESFKAMAAQTGRFEDPMLMLGVQNGLMSRPFSFTKDPSTAKVIGISQNIPFFGKRKLRQTAANAEAESYRWLVEERKLELAKMVKDTYYQLFATDQAITIAENNIQILDQIATLALERYNAGQGSAQDVSKAEIEKSRLFEAQLELQQQRTTLVAELNSLLYRDPQHPLPQTEAPKIQPIAYSSDQLTKLAIEARPMLKSYLAMMEKAQSDEALAKREYYPDFAISAEYMQRERSNSDPGDDMFSIKLSFNLPFQKERRAAMVRQASAIRSTVREEINSLKNTISRSIVTLLAQLKQKEKQLALYSSDILPRTQQNFALVTTEYRAGKVDFLTLLEARNSQLEAEKAYFSALAEYGSIKGQLESVVGTSLGNSP